jgi:hypothetical protein
LRIAGTKHRRAPGGGAVVRPLARHPQPCHRDHPHRPGCRRVRYPARPAVRSHRGADDRCPGRCGPVHRPVRHAGIPSVGRGLARPTGPAGHSRPAGPPRRSAWETRRAGHPDQQGHRYCGPRHRGHVGHISRPNCHHHHNKNQRSHHRSVLRRYRHPRRWGLEGQRHQPRSARLRRERAVTGGDSASDDPAWTTPGCSTGSLYTQFCRRSELRTGIYPATPSGEDLRRKRRGHLVVIDNRVCGLLWDTGQPTRRFPRMPASNQRSAD